MIKHHVDILIDENSLAACVKQLGDNISTYYATLQKNSTHPLILIGLLRGSYMFMADLSRKITCPHTIDFMTASSYGSATMSSGDVKILKDLEEDIAGKHVLIIEDIIDSGNTLSKVTQILSLRQPASIEICTLLDKPARRETEVRAKWSGFTIEDQFVVGYGIDYAEHYRHLPYIGIVVPE
ncbi:hypoxanthine phosphoribosyltransferase [Thorsellia kenyensis]|uniref:Hypoxanthine phosphoribosyltransferase n=1 Tax=Thorsellia kenyensis TaxID=1549888 RepID=A0ABV6CCB4_9GAMM